MDLMLDLALPVVYLCLQLIVRNRDNLFEEMLQEPDEVAMKRKHTRETLHVLQQAFRVGYTLLLAYSSTCFATELPVAVSWSPNLISRSSVALVKWLPYLVFALFKIFEMHLSLTR